jgi:hypothetical protein
MEKQADYEKNLQDPALSPYESAHEPEDMGEVIIASRPNFLKKLNHILSRLGGEERGIERVLPHEKSDQVNPYINK